MRRVRCLPLVGCAAHITYFLWYRCFDSFLGLHFFIRLCIFHQLGRPRDQRLLLLDLVVIQLLSLLEHGRTLALHLRYHIDDLRRQRRSPPAPIVSDSGPLVGDTPVALADCVLQTVNASELILPLQLFSLMMSFVLLLHDLGVYLLTHGEVSLAAQERRIARAHAGKKGLTHGGILELFLSLHFVFHNRVSAGAHKGIQHRTSLVHSC
mmetsp:Transcript_110441/g.276477  ORF Transcript_110441/g.276477 Transcript_110441/m.276477 type:complete len:209 (+) Transcript_110441:283-909(+)